MEWTTNNQLLLRASVFIIEKKQPNGISIIVFIRKYVVTVSEIECVKH